MNDSPYISVKWGTFSKQFDNRPPELRHLHDLHSYANFILDNPEKFSKRTERRARFYLNMIDPKGGAIQVKMMKELIDNSYKHDKTQIGQYNLQPMSSKETQVWVNYYAKHVIIVFTGTYSALDWVNNYEMAKGNYQNTSRFKRAKSIFEEAVSQFQGFKITIVGHSQAGMIIHLLDDPRVFEAIGYNPAYFPTTKQKENEYIVKTKGDPVSIFVRPNERNTIFSTKSSNPLYNHSTLPLEELPQTKMIGKGLTYKQKFNEKYGFPKDESHSIEEIADLTGYDENGLKIIYRKGIGAYHTNPQSVRPQVHSPEQWAYSRVFASVDPTSKASKVDASHLIKGGDFNMMTKKQLIKYLMKHRVKV